MEKLGSAMVWLGSEPHGSGIAWLRHAKEWLGKSLKRKGKEQF